MAMIAQVFGIEGIVGAFFAGLALNRLVPNEGPSMERIEFFGAAVFVPVFLVSIGLLLDPSVMFTGRTLGLAALLVAAALGGKAIACALAGPLFKFSRAETVAMYVLTIPQAAATLAVTLIGFEIGLFGTSVVNAVLVLILVSIVVAALVAQRVVLWIPPRASSKRALGGKVLVVTPSTGPTDAAVRAATLIARPDGGHSDVLITRTPAEQRPDPAVVRALEKRIFSHGFDGHVHTRVTGLSEAVTQATIAAEASLVIVDDPTFEAPPGPLPLLVLDGVSPEPRPMQVIADADGSNDVAAEIDRRLARGAAKPLRIPRRTASSS
jgi:hypothetical protein